ncbi:MAG: hypothetical protein FWC79_04685 [Oscillospiraceae bacterium]|nr:hypothetical protein [Oscillospiraceae bacterium]
MKNTFRKLKLTSRQVANWGVRISHFLTAALIIVGIPSFLVGGISYQFVTAATSPFWYYLGQFGGLAFISAFGVYLLPGLIEALWIFIKLPFMIVWVLIVEPTTNLIEFIVARKKATCC